jgi:hypothetical protein
MIISRSQKLSLILLLLLALFITACGGGAAPAETEAAEATDAPPTQARATAAPTATQVDLIADSSAIADTFPCEARTVDDQGSILRVVHRLADPAAPVVGARRAGSDILLGNVEVNDTGTWYSVIERNLTVGYIQPEYVLLGASCVSGGGGAEAEATGEATAEATEES